jgi:hypothetical protein
MIIEYGREALLWGSGHVQFVKNDEHSTRKIYN